MYKSVVTKKNIISFVIILIIFFIPRIILAYTIEIPIGTAPTAVELPKYIVSLHAFGTTIVGILAVVMMMIGGFLWLSSAGNANQVSTGRGLIVGALIGLMLTFFSYYILYAISPNLVNLSIKTPVRISAGDTKKCCDLGKDANQPRFKFIEEFECVTQGGTALDSMAFCEGSGCEAYNDDSSGCDKKAECQYTSGKCQAIDDLACEEINYWKCPTTQPTPDKYPRCSLPEPFSCEYYDPCKSLDDIACPQHRDIVTGAEDCQWNDGGYLRPGYCEVKPFGS